MPCHSLLRRLSGLHDWREGTPLLTRAVRRLSHTTRASSFTAVVDLWQTVRPHLRGFTVATALLGTITSTLSVYPHQLAYFNELAGGPENGHKHLLGSNLDWGQDLLLLHEWCEKRFIDPLRLAWHGSYLPSSAGLLTAASTIDASWQADSLPLSSGLYAVSVSALYGSDGNVTDGARWFRMCDIDDVRSALLSETCVAQCGYSIYIIRAPP